MKRSTKIEWSQHTWNYFVGCNVLSSGCTNCYAMKTAARIESFGNVHYRGLTKPSKAGAVWTGKTALNSLAAQNKPLSIPGKALIFVNSMSDFFGAEAKDEWRAGAIEVMRKAPQHVFQILTKRPENILPAYARLGIKRLPDHVWIGTTVEDGRVLDRIDMLRAVPAATRFISAEPLIGSLKGADYAGIHWVITGGESGPKARVCNPLWVREIKAGCEAQGVPLFHKQWGSYASNPLVFEQKLPLAEAKRLDTDGKGGKLLDGKLYHAFPDTPFTREAGLITALL